MNTINRANEPNAGDRPDLPACPICHEPGPLGRQQATMGGQEYVWYECGVCHSALMALGDGRWVFQKITRPEHAHLLRQPLTLLDLRLLLPPSQPRSTGTVYHEAPPSRPWPAAPSETTPTWSTPQAPVEPEPRFETTPTWSAPQVPVEPAPRFETAPTWSTPQAPVEPAPREPEPVIPLEREVTGIDELRAALVREEEVHGPVVEKAGTAGGARALPSPFAIAVAVLGLLLVAGIALILVVVLSSP